MGRRPTVHPNLMPRMRARKKSGGIYYYYETGENRKEIPLGKDYIAAVQKCAKLQMTAPVVAMTVAWAIQQYKLSPSYLELGAGTKADYNYALDKIVAQFGDAPLDEVTSHHLIGYMELRTLGDEKEKLKASKHRAQREINVLGRVFKYARSRGWTKNDPKESVEIKKLPGRKKVVITDEMFDAVYAKAPADLRDAIDLAYYIGQRPADVLKLSELDIKDGTLVFFQNKTDAPMEIGIVGGLKEVIERMQARKRQFKVQPLALIVNERGKPMTKSMLRSRFEAARLAAGIPGAAFQFRDLRRKAGRDLRKQVSTEAAQDLLGHASITMTEHYTGGPGKKVTAIPMRKTK